MNQEGANLVLVVDDVQLGQPTQMILVPDHARTCVTNACLYEPHPNPSASSSQVTVTGAPNGAPGAAPFLIAMTLSRVSGMDQAPVTSRPRRRHQYTSPLGEGY